MLNTVMLEGRITKQPELRQTKTGHKAAFITLAVQPSKNEIVDFINVTLFEKTAELVTDYCGKGDLISVLGYLRTYKKEGKTEMTVVGSEVHFLARKYDEPKEVK